MSEQLNYIYSKKEEFLNVLSHGFGLVLSLIHFLFYSLKGLRMMVFGNQQVLLSMDSV